jgi:putative transposase
MKLGFKVSWQTVRRIMIEHGLIDDPKHKKAMPWSTFIKAHFQSMAACDFFTLEAWTPKGLRRFLFFFVIDLSSRRVQIIGIDEAPDGEWMLQQARNLTDPENGFLKGKRFLIHDRDPLYTTEFRKTLKAGGVRSLKMPKWSPNLNSHCERFVQSIQVECLDKMILFGERHVRYVVEQYAGKYYHEERPHQGLGNRTIIQPTEVRPTAGRILCRERLGGLLKSYYRKAA